MLHNPRPRHALLGLGVPLLGLLASASRTLPSMVDDAYVSARYAHMLAIGEGIRYNAGLPPVEGYTDFLWVLWMAPGTVLPLHYATWATGWGLAFGVLGLLCAAGLTRALVPGRPAAGVVSAGVLAALPHYAIASTNGLETSMFVAGVLGAAWAAARGSRWVGPLCGSLYLVRPEGLVVGGLFAVWAALTTRRWSPLAGMAAVVAPYFLGRYAWFGTLVPNTWNAQARYGFVEMCRMNGGYFTDALPVLAGAALATVLALGLTLWRRSDPTTLGPAVLLAGAGALAAISLQVFNWMPGLRLFQPSLALLTVAVVALTAPLKRGRAALGVVAAGWLGWLTLGPPRLDAEAYDRATTVQPGNGGEILGLAIAAAAPAGSWLLVRDAGVVPYYAGAGVNVIDTHPFSLTDPALTGKPFDADHLLDRDVSVIVTTGKRPGQVTDYPDERRLLADPRVADRLRRTPQVQQHAGRYFIAWVRDDVALSIPPDAQVSAPKGSAGD